MGDLQETLRLIRQPDRMIELALEYEHHPSETSQHWTKLRDVLFRTTTDEFARGMFEDYAKHLVMHGSLSLAQIQTLAGEHARGRDGEATLVPCPWCFALTGQPCTGPKSPILKTCHQERWAAFWVVTKWPRSFGALVALDCAKFDSDKRTVWLYDVPRGAHCHDELSSVGVRLASREKYTSPRTGKTAKQRVALVIKAIKENTPDLIREAARQ